MHSRLIVPLALLCLSAVPRAVSAQERVGVVTAAVGPVMVARATDTSEPLRFRDEVFLRDRITTGERATTRLLLGGKVLVTARERSTLALSEVPGATTIDVTGGRVAVTVDRGRLRDGELVEVRTPHAVTTVSGDTLIVDVRPDASTFTALAGRVDVFRLDPATGAAAGSPARVAAREAVTVRGEAVSRPRAITALRARELADEFTPPVRAVSPLELGAVRDDLARALETLSAVTGSGAPPAPIQPVVTPAAPPAAAPASTPPRPEFRPGRGPGPFVFGPGRFHPGDRDGGPGPRR